MHLLMFAFLLGVVTGLRSMLGPAAVSCAARLGWLHLAGTPLAFLGNAYMPYVLTILAIGELIGDKLPMTPSRKRLFPFAGRVILGGVCGAALGLSTGSVIVGILAGALGGVVGTLGGAAARSRLAAAFGRDFPAALLEDAVAIALAILLVAKF